VVSPVIGRTASRFDARCAYARRGPQEVAPPGRTLTLHLREIPVYRIKIKRFSAESSGAASMDQHLSSPETRRCFTPTMARTIAMLRPLCLLNGTDIFKYGGKIDARALVGKLRDHLHGPDHHRLVFRAECGSGPRLTAQLIYRRNSRPLTTDRLTLLERCDRTISGALLDCLLTSC
jgi:hypothetical protein